LEIVSHNIAAKIGRPVLIMPVGDIQWHGHEDFVAIKMLARHIAWGVDQGAYFLGMGDYIDFMSPSNRSKLAGAGFYDTSAEAIDDKAIELADELFDKALAPSKGRWLGLLEGHHYAQLRDGSTTDQYLARKLNARFLGSSAYVRLVLTAGNKRVPCVIWAHHGNGGGSGSGAPLNRLDAVTKTFDADVYLMGHQHKLVGAPVDYVTPVFDKSGGHLKHRTKMLACTGSFLKGYVANSRQGSVPRGTYVEQKMLNPVSLGGALLRATMEMKDGHLGLDLKVEL
jgi:hypothetical protein